LQQQQQQRLESSGDEAGLLQGGLGAEQPVQQLSEGVAEEGVAEAEGLIADASAPGAVEGAAVNAEVTAAPTL
jgi:hypothetical protein